MKNFCILCFVFLLPLIADAGEVGSPAPLFSLRDGKNNAVTLENFKGKAVFLVFWAPWCALCKEELQELEVLYRKYRNAGLEVVGISVASSNKAISRFLEKTPLSFTILPDDRSAASDAYRCTGLPTGFLITRDGVIHRRYAGFSREFLPVYEREILELLRHQP
jgi:peroxiredoxin